MGNRACVRCRPLVASLLIVYLAALSSVVAAEIIKSPSDDRTYEGFILGNGLRILLISDADTRKAAVALDVGVGHAHDPDERQGLAHFLEHMLFLGTKKYPSPGEFKQFIAAHGGMHNAYTAFENTSYYFDIDSQYLAPALNRFSQFFAEPLFLPEYVEREKHAVDAEYRSKLRSDWWRTLDAKKQVVNPSHPFAQFGIGSLETLADHRHQNIRDELIGLHRRHYSADRMALVVLGREPSAVLRQWVTENFSSIAGGEAPSSTDSMRPALFEPDALPARIYVTPIGSRRSLSLVFPMPPARAYVREKPIGYLASLIGHEGKGSLISALKKVGWAHDLKAGIGLDHQSEATFNVSIQLTETGKFHLDDIVAAFFQYLELVKSQGIRDWIFRENQKLADIRFRFQDDSKPLVYVRRLASNLQRYQMQNVIRGPYVMEAYNPDVIARYLGFLRPNNLLLIVLCDGIQTDAVSPWFKAAYRVEKVTPVEIQEWRKQKLRFDLSIPSPNPFLPDDLSLKPIASASDAPQLLERTGGYELWYRQDSSYPMPRANFHLSVRSPMANDSSSHTALTTLYVAAVNDALAEFAYPAKRAGLEYALYHHRRGFSLRVSGFNDKQHALVAAIIHKLQNLEVEESSFERIKSILMRHLRDRISAKPYRKSISELANLLVQPHWSDEEQLHAMSVTSVEGFTSFIRKMLGQVSLVAFSHGNLTRSDALALGKLIQVGLPHDALPVAGSDGHVIRLAPGDELVRAIKSDHPDSAIAIYFQGADRSDRITAQFSLLRQIIDAPFYHDIRTENQLGYVAFSALTTLLGMPGLTFVVQSPTADSSSLDRQVENFIARFDTQITLMSDQEFESYKAGLLNRMLKIEETFEERSSRLWDEINQREYQFDSQIRLAAALHGITKADFEHFYRHSLLKERRRRLSIRCVGTSHRATAPSIDEISKRTLIKGRRLFSREHEHVSRAPLPSLVAPIQAVLTQGINRSQIYDRV